ncbi:hypothetical protein LXL04_037743 [Taraxacum kok-saghyz]
MKHHYNIKTSIFRSLEEAWDWLDLQSLSNDRKSVLEVLMGTILWSRDNHGPRDFITHVKRYHSSGTSTQKFTHLTKPTSKLPVPNTMDQKRSKNKCQ